MKLKHIKLLLWAIFMLLLALYLLAFGSNFLSIVSLGLVGVAILFAIGSWILAYISEDDEK